MFRRPLCAAALVMTAVIALSGAMRTYGGKRAAKDGPQLSGVSPAAAYEGGLSFDEVSSGAGRIRKVSRYEGGAALILTDVLIRQGNNLYECGDLRVSVPSGEGHRVGDKAAFTGTVKAIESPANPGEFDRAAYYAADNVFLECRADEVYADAPSGVAVPQDAALAMSALRNPGGLRAAAYFVRRTMDGLRAEAVSRIRRVYKGERAAFFAAVLTGDRSLMDDGAESVWRRSGLMHILAISGLHLTLIGNALYILLLKLRMPRRGAAALSAAVLGLYTVFTGASVSTVRAYIMFLALSVSRLIWRTYDAASALALAAMCVLAAEPEMLFNSGFQMSYLAALICVIFGDGGGRSLPLMLQLYLLPLVLISNSEFSPLSLPLNYLVIPAVPYMIAAGGVGMLTGGPLAAAAGLAAEGAAGAAKAVISLPHSVIICGRPSAIRTAVYAALLVPWSWAWRRLRLYKRRFLLLLALPLMIWMLAGGRGDDELLVTFLSVGQGDGIVIEMPGGGCVLIDGGSSTRYGVGRNILLPYLLHRGIGRVDAIFLTHGDEDHLSGVRELLGMIARGETSVRVGTVVMPCGRRGSDALAVIAALSERAGAEVLTACRGDAFSYGETSLRVIAPERDAAFEDENEGSLVLGLGFGEFDCIFTGDVEGEGERSLTEMLKKEGRHYEVLKVAHHGSANSTPSEFLEAVRPSLSVISCGRNNSYGHPHPELLGRLETGGSDIMRTDLDGAVTVRSDGRRFCAESVYGIISSF